MEKVAEDSSTGAAGAAEKTTSAILDDDSISRKQCCRLLELPKDIRILFIKDWLIVEEIIRLRVVCQSLFVDQEDVFQTQKFQSHGFDKYTFKSAQAANWVIYKTIDLRSFYYEPNDHAPDGTCLHPLISACANGELAIAKLLLARGAVDITSKLLTYCYRKQTMAGSVLHFCCLIGMTEVVRLLCLHCDAPSLINHYDLSGLTPLQCAIKAGHLDIVQLLVKFATAMALDPNVRNKNNHDIGLTALLMAAQHNDLAIVKELLPCQGIDINAVSNEGESALCMAILANNVELVELLLRDTRTNVNFLLNGESLLYHCIIYDYADLVQTLIQDARVEFQVDGESPLYFAAKHGCLDAALVLLRDVRTEVGRVSRYGFTALSTAVSNGHEDVALAILAQPSLSTEQTSEKDQVAGFTASDDSLHNIVSITIKMNLLDVFRSLIERNECRLRINDACDDRGSALYLAILYGRYEMVEALLNLDNLDLHRPHGVYANAITAAQLILPQHSPILQLLRADPRV